MGPAVAAAFTPSCLSARPSPAAASSSSPRTTALPPSRGPPPPRATAPFLGCDAVPPLGLGMAALGRPGYINLGHSEDMTRGTTKEEMREHAWEVLDAAYEAGVRYFDCARSYGEAESFVSGWLSAREIAPGTVAVGSKWGYYYTADWQIDTGGEPHEVKEHTYENLARQQVLTHERLGDHIGLYQIHSATLDSGVLERKEVLDELARIKTELGWKMGLSLSGVAQGTTLRKAMQVQMPGPGGGMLFDSVQATWNLLEQSAGDALLEAHDAGMRVIVKEGMANGRLFPGNYGEGGGRAAPLAKAAEEAGVAPDALALACIIAQPFRPVVLSGAATVEHVRSNAAALAAVGAAEAAAPALMAAMRADPEEYWSERAGLAWN